MINYGKFYIDGEWVDPIGTGTFELVDPATEASFASVSLGNAEDVNRAVGAARRAFPAFSRTTKKERIDLLNRITAEFEAREDAILAAITQEMGAPSSMKAHTRTAVDNFRQAVSTLGDYEFE